MHLTTNKWFPEFLIHCEVFFTEIKKLVTYKIILYTLHSVPETP